MSNIRKVCPYLNIEEVAMSSGIIWNKTRQRMIRDHISKQNTDAEGRDRLPNRKLVIKGKVEREPIYRFSLKDVAFNKMNGRIKAEVLEKEAELGRELEVSEEEDQKIIKEILLSIRPDENAKIRDDLKNNEQIDPGIITCDGIVINGNRRKALLEEIYGERGYFEAHVLPSDITKAELWLIEAGIQMSAPQQLDYSPINDLLKLKEGLNSGLDIEDMVPRLYGITGDKIRNDLARLGLIDEYLTDFLNKEGRYYLVKNLHEHFIDLQVILNWAERPRGKTLDWKPDASDINELKIVGFNYIRIKYPHLRIRGLRDLFASEDSWKHVKKAIVISSSLTKEEKSFIDTQDGEIEEDIDEVDDENIEDESTFSTSSEEKDLQEEAIWRKSHTDTLKNYYEDAKEQEQIIKDSQKPLILAKKALKYIKAVPEKKKVLQEPEMDDILKQIIEKTNRLRKITMKMRSSK